MAGDLTVAEGAQRRHREFAGIGAVRATAIEAAHVRSGSIGLRGSPVRRSLLPLSCSRGTAATSAWCRDAGMFEDFGGGAGFDDLAEIHHQHAVAEKPHHGKIVRDE